MSRSCAEGLTAQAIFMPAGQSVDGLWCDSFIILNTSCTILEPSLMTKRTLRVWSGVSAIFARVDNVASLYSSPAENSSSPRPVENQAGGVAGTTSLRKAMSRPWMFLVHVSCLSGLVFIWAIGSALAPVVTLLLLLSEQLTSFLAGVRRSVTNGFQFLRNLSRFVLTLVRVQARAVYGRWRLRAVKGSTARSVRFAFVCEEALTASPARTSVIERLTEGIERSKCCLIFLDEDDRTIRCPGEKAGSEKHFLIGAEWQIKRWKHRSIIRRINFSAAVFIRAVRIAEILTTTDCPAVITDGSSAISPRAARLAARFAGLRFHPLFLNRLSEP